jgi:hypothetical protein
MRAGGDYWKGRAGIGAVRLHVHVIEDSRKADSSRDLKNVYALTASGTGFEIRCSGTLPFLRSRLEFPFRSFAFTFAFT